MAHFPPPKTLSVPKVPREVKRKCVTLLEKIGSGNFGEVHTGLLDEHKEVVNGVPSYVLSPRRDYDSNASAVHAMRPKHDPLQVQDCGEDGDRWASSRNRAHTGGIARY